MNSRQVRGSTADWLIEANLLAAGFEPANKVMMFPLPCSLQFALIKLFVFASQSLGVARGNDRFVR